MISIASIDSDKSGIARVCLNLNTGVNVSRSRILQFIALLAFNILIMWGYFVLPTALAFGGYLVVVSVSWALMSISSGLLHHDAESTGWQRSTTAVAADEKELKELQGELSALQDQYATDMRRSVVNLKLD